MKAKKNCFTFLFYIRKNEVNKHGECGIMCRMTIRGEKASISTRRTIAPELWDTTSGRVIGRTAKAQEINKVINDLQLTLQRHYYDIEREKGYATCEMVMNAYMGIKAKQESLMPIYKEFLEETKALIGIQKSQKTFDKYERCFRRVQEFMKSKYNISDIALRDLKPIFLVDFEVFLATKKGCSTNTIYKFLQLLRMPILKAQRMGVNFPDPYLGYKMKKESVDRGYLTEDEVVEIATHPINVERLDQIRDIFIFACYTGLAYADMANLKAENIQKMFDGKMWIVTHRQKTKTNVNVPLLPMAQKILEKYQREDQSKDECVLPMISNQKTNAYLKEIADICGIDKNLTFHLARHTFYASNLLDLAG